MDPSDLLYADNRRIDHYFAQIGGRSSRPKFSGELVLSWHPSLKVHAAEQTEKPSAYAKIDAIKNYLEKQSLLRFSRPLQDDENIDFVEEICLATRIEIPPRRSATNKGKKLVLWACSPEQKAEHSGILILVQDFNYPDERPTSFRSASTFSVLSALVYNTRKEIDSSIIGVELPHEAPPNPDAQFGTTDHPWSLSEYHAVRNYIYDFATEPASLLKSWNCAIFPKRRINVVYKVREWGRDSAHGWQKTTVFAYPLWIFAA